MKNIATVAIFGVLTCFVFGCAAPMPKKLAESDRQRAARYMASNPPCGASGLVWRPFPDLQNPFHLQIRNALMKKGEIGDGFGRICNYYGYYLVTVSAEPSGVQSFSSYFYDPKSHSIFNANEGIAFSFYRGNREASATNVVALVRHVLAVNGFQALIVSNATDIPHTEFTKDNPGLSFTNLLFAKGIVISPPTLLKKNEHAELDNFSEYSVFVYMPVGGQLFRYEVQCYEGYISGLRRYLVSDGIGDCWYLM